MPVLESKYKAPFWSRSGHFATIFSSLCRVVKAPKQERERLVLPDGDFLDLDWTYAQDFSKQLVVLLHGLEGSAQRPYMTSAAKLFSEHNYDVLAVNFRGCSGVPNAVYRSYHSGATEDLEAVIEHIQSLSRYQDIYIKGVSLGGNLVLKYLGEDRAIPPQIRAVVAVSVPCNLQGSCDELHKLKNKLYANRFLKHLKEKLLQKVEAFPDQVTLIEYHSIKKLIDFDEVYTSKAHGFESAMDYYLKCSSNNVLADIKIPTLIINALNDSFLSPDCYPVKFAKTNPNLYLEMPQHGGHVGFITNKGFYYNELRALEFFEKGL